MKHAKYLILGAGVSGISAAVFLTKSEDYLILEKTNSVGGYCKTIKKDGFTWDYSGHFFHFRNDEIRDLVLKNINSEEIISVEKNTAILYKEKFISFPFQRNISELDKNEFVDCLYDFYFRKSKTHYDNFLDWIYGTLGNSIVDKFIKPYNEKLYATDLNLLDVDAMGRFFPQVTMDEIITSFKGTDKANSYNNVFLYPRNGAISYINSLMNYVDPEKIEFNSEVLNIDKERKIVKTNQGEYSYQYLITSVPLNYLLAISGTQHNKNLYTSNKVLVLNLGFDKPSALNFHWLYIPDPEISFYRIGFYDNILGEKRASLYVEIGLETNVEVNKNKILDKVLGELRNLEIISDHKLVSYEFVEMNPAYIHLTTESILESQTKINELAMTDIYSIGRYGEWTYCAIEDNIVSAKACIERIKGA
jgi:protoporphyrinogen oxidase